MASNAYISLRNSNSSINKKFKSVQRAPVLERSDELSRTIGGVMDKSAGAITATHQFILRVPAETADSQYGTLSDLKALFILNNPNGTPSDVITLTDHDTTEHACVFVGSLSPEHMTTMLEGPNASYLVKVQLAEIAPV